MHGSAKLNGTLECDFFARKRAPYTDAKDSTQLHNALVQHVRVVMLRTGSVYHFAKE
jgi:hypothetical protein